MTPSLSTLLLHAHPPCLLHSLGRLSRTLSTPLPALLPPFTALLLLAAHLTLAALQSSSTMSNSRLARCCFHCAPLSRPSPTPKASFGHSRCPLANFLPVRYFAWYEIKFVDEELNISHLHPSLTFHNPEALPSIRAGRPDSIPPVPALQFALRLPGCSHVMSLGGYRVIANKSQRLVKESRSLNLSHRVTS